MNVAICDNMGGPQRDYASKISQTEKSRYCMISPICVILKNKAK